jgi:hypothetical protein
MPQRQDMMQHFEKGKHSPKDAGHLFITKILPSFVSYVSSVYASSCRSADIQPFSTDGS